MGGKKSNSKWKRWLRRMALTSLASMVVVVVVCWLAFQHIPSWYAPPQIEISDIPRIRATLPNTYQSFTDSLVAGDVFEFTLSAETVNEWIAARSAIWPDARDWLPVEIKEPAVAFAGDSLIVAGRVERENWKAILSIHFKVAVDGDELVVQVSKVGVGSLPVPRDALIENLDDYVSQWDIGDADFPDTVADFGRPFIRTQSVRPYFEGVRVPNLIRWSNGGREFRFLAVRADEGVLTLRVEPL